jgi:hypothetical protein
VLSIFIHIIALIKKKTPNEANPRRRSRGFAVRKEVVIVVLLSRNILPINTKASMVRGIPRKKRR